MKNYLVNHREAVIKMNLVEYNEQDEHEGILEDGIEQGMFMALSSLVDDGLITAKEAAKRLGMSLEEFIRRAESLQ